MLKEIAYHWDKTFIKTVKVIPLVCLRDPSFESIPDLLINFCKGDPEATEISNTRNRFLLENGGKDLVLLFDGFDEIPEKLQTSSLISDHDILKRHALPFCGI